MSRLHARRQFIRTAAATSALVAGGGLAFFSGLPRVSAKEAVLDTKAVRFSDELKPFVRLLEETPRDRLLEEVGARIRRTRQCARSTHAGSPERVTLESANR